MKFETILLLFVDCGDEVAKNEFSLLQLLFLLRQFHITYYRYLQSSGGHWVGKGAAIFPMISDFQNFGTDLLKAFHFCAESFDFDKNKLEYQFFLLKKIDDETVYILCCRRAFSDVLEGMTSKSSSSSKRPDP